jgi:hypothetical protein
MRALTLDDFTGRLGESYEMLVGDQRLPVVLEEAHSLPGGAREASGFRLLFRGPLEPIAPQDIYSFEGGSETHEIFVVPVAQVQDGIQYEAIFM